MVSHTPNVTFHRNCCVKKPFDDCGFKCKLTSAFQWNYRRRYTAKHTNFSVSLALDWKGGGINRKLLFRSQSPNSGVIEPYRKFRLVCIFLKL